jgi:rhamnose transport system substrate-binding protein
MGEYTVGENGEVVMGPPLEFNKDNIDDFNF